jgi:hypothetical protein
VARVLVLGRELELPGHVVESDAGVDPERLATVTPRLEGVSVLCWLYGESDSETLHGDRLRALLEYLVDTPVRGVVYERSERFPDGEQIVASAQSTFRMPCVVIAPGDDVAAAVLQVLSA